MSFTLSQLVELSQQGQSHVFSAPALAAAMKSINEEKEKSVGAVCATLINSFLSQLSASVSHLRKLRKLADEQAKFVKQLDRAMKYFGETANPLPVFTAIYRNDKHEAKRYGHKHLGGMIDMESVPEEAWEVPAEWQPN